MDIPILTVNRAAVVETEFTASSYDGHFSKMAASSHRLSLNWSQELYESSTTDHAQPSSIKYTTPVSLSILLAR